MQSTEVDLLLGLPSELSCCLVGSWLEWKDVTKVDTAYCQRSKRSALLAVLSLPAFDLCNHPSEHSSPAFYKWASTRHVKVTCMVACRTASVCEKYAEKFGAHVSSLTLSSVGISEPSELMPGPYQLMRLCPNVASLILQRCVLGRSFLQPFLDLVGECQSIRELSIEECFCSWNQKANEEPLQATLQRRLSLTKLTLAQGLVPHIVLSFMTNVVPAKLTHLEIETSNEHVQRLLRVLLPQCVNLKSLRFSGDLDDATLIEFLGLCPQIESLNLSCVRGLSDDSAFTIANTLHQLKSLHVKDCDFTDVLIDQLVKHGQDTLEFINVEQYFSDITYKGISRLLQHSRALRTLEASPSQLMHLQAPYLGNLTTLHVALDDHEYQPKSAEVKTFLRALAPHGANLHHLKISAAGFGLGDILSISRCNFAQLRTLHLITSSSTPVASNQAVVEALNTQIPGAHVRISTRM